jgi:hypothetical protein
MNLQLPNSISMMYSALMPGSLGVAGAAELAAIDPEVENAIMSDDRFVEIAPAASMDDFRRDATPAHLDIWIDHRKSLRFPVLGLGGNMDWYITGGMIGNGCYGMLEGAMTMGAFVMPEEIDPDLFGTFVIDQWFEQQDEGWTDSGGSAWFGLLDTATGRMAIVRNGYGMDAPTITAADETSLANFVACILTASTEGGAIREGLKRLFEGIGVMGRQVEDIFRATCTCKFLQGYKSQIWPKNSFEITKLRFAMGDHKWIDWSLEDSSAVSGE